nr:hypothetical protein [uncultured Actinotalea sp.]
MAAPPRSGRPSPAERRRRRTRTLALVVAIALVATLAIPLAALATPGRPSGPLPVGAADVSVADAQSLADAREVLGRDDLHEVWLWSTAFLRGDAAALAAPLDGADQWLAGAATGTRTAWLDPDLDRVVLAASDDDAELAAALAALATDDRLVTDEGDWLVLAADGTVRSLVPDRVGEGPAAPTALADFQATRAARWEAVMAAAGDDAGDTGAGSGGTDDAVDAAGADGLRAVVPWVLLVALVLTGSAVAVRARRGRTAGEEAGGAGQAAVGSASPRSS